MKKLFIALWILSINAISIFAADICQWNICIDPNWSIYIKNNETIYSSLIDEPTNTWWNTNTWILLNTWINISTWQINTGTSLNTWTSNNNTNTVTSYKSSFSNRNEELDEAIWRWYTNELTIYDNITDYQANNLLLREQAAKLFYQSALVVEFNGEPYNECSFSDINNVSDSLKENIKNVCTLWWLMKWNNSLFSPTKNLTYAEAITVIARIAWIKNTNTKYAWRTPYLSYVKNLWILKNTNINENTMENKITRWELIVLLYRLSITYNENWGNLYDLWTKELDSINLPSDNNSSNSLVSIGAGVIDTPKFTTALLRMYHSNMTVYWKASDYDPFNVTTREQAAKLLSIYSKKIENTNINNNITCNYTDTKSSSLENYIIDACKKWIFRNTNTFNPSNAIIKSEFVTAILNMLQEKPWTWETISSKALELEIISKADLNTFDKPITRYEVALMLSNLHLKSEFIKNLKDTSITYNVISPIDKDTTTYPAWQQKVFIDINSIDSKEFNNWFINLFGKTYKIN